MLVTMISVDPPRIERDSMTIDVGTGESKDIRVDNPSDIGVSTLALHMPRAVKRIDDSGGQQYQTASTKQKPSICVVRTCPICQAASSQ